MDAKKKKNKKKKGNQNKAVEDAANTSSVEVVPQEQSNGSVVEENHSITVSNITSVEVVPQEQSNGSLVEENHSIHSYSNADVQSVGALEFDMEQEKQKEDEAKFIKLQEAIKQLGDERHSWLQKQATFEDKIDVLQKEVSLFIQKETALEQTFQEFQMANDSLMQKQIILEDKIKNVDDIKDSLVIKESLLKEMIARVEETNISLQTQVKQLEWSRNNILEENQRLMENITLLQAKVENLEKDVSSHVISREMSKPAEGQIIIEQVGVDAVVEKRIAENIELARKVSETYTEEGHHDDVADPTSSIEINQDRMSNVYLTPRKHVLEYHDGTSETAERAHSAVGIVNDKNAINDFVSENIVLSRPLPGLDNSRISDEIVTVPLDEIQIDEDDSLEAQNDDKPESIPLSDAPLIGAPFRLISFVAKYVSGADLVNQKSSGSHR